MIFEQLNPHACRTYLIGNNNLAVMVDPVIDHFNDYLQTLKSRELKLTHVIDTHTHADHISASSVLKDATGCEYIMHVNAPAKCVSIHVSDGDMLTLNGLEFKFLYTPGHTKDSISIVVGDKFLTGDFLFLDDGGAGRDDLPGGDPEEHWESLNKLSLLPDSIIIYPAHEYRNRVPSFLSKQRKTNPHLKKSNKEEFIEYIEDLKLGPADWMKDVLKANYTCAKDPNAAWIPIDVPACEVKGTMEKGVNEIDVNYIEVGTLKNMIETNLKNIFLIDVREKYELSDQLGHIEGVINIPIGSLSHKQKELHQYKDKDMIVICRSGARATTGGQILMQAGFKNVYVLQGGMLAWKTMQGE
ncbi:rhodanese-like domain-containing protein [Clostridium sp. WILCCON 0269]|uniref:Rhodanese-like domain-containing protein n=1 Tax=Candidatus Clostridium eludens TaxID=3381663 RepID=A0ABW8SHZ6_9CLOT